MEIKPVAYFRSPLGEKFGIPRQAGLSPQLLGTIELAEPYDNAEALRGLQGFDYLWLVWGFSLNGEGSREHSETDGIAPGGKDSEAPGSSCNYAAAPKLTVRPPRLGGNTRVGVFASRSPFRPNGLGLSSVRIESVDASHCEITVSGADLADGTPIYDIKPYLSYTDSHPEARCGYVDEAAWDSLRVEIPDNLLSLFSQRDAAALKEVLSLDPRPRYQDDPERVYGLLFAGRNVRFKVSSGKLTVIDA